ncbi:MAG: OmpH family outer membrane protein [Verrucomicrobiae bacterium]|nr:OmpH family outer membrane protein [Verrucomicrobiae bacterium]NNJ43005.1 OmpH family outer membrane protein [Akkermansiaceae bacterium]
MKFACFLLLAVTLAGGISRADQMRVATVNVRQIFDAWNDSIQSQETFKQAKKALDQENSDRLAVIKQHQIARTKLHQEFKANHASMSDAEKNKLDARYRSLGRDATALEQDRLDFLKKGEREWARAISSESKLILDRIHQAVQVYALEKKYQMVVESGGQTTRDLPLFVHLAGAVDITSDVIDRLNQPKEN